MVEKRFSNLSNNIYQLILKNIFTKKPRKPQAINTNQFLKIIIDNKILIKTAPDQGITCGLLHLTTQLLQQILGKNSYAW